MNILFGTRDFAFWIHLIDDISDKAKNPSISLNTRMRYLNIFAWLVADILRATTSSFLVSDIENSM